MSLRATKWAHSILPVLGVPPTERLVLMCLAFHHNESSGQCFPSMQLLADECGVSSRRIHSAVATLVEWGVITKKRGGTSAGNASNKYTLFGAPKWPRKTGNRVPVRKAIKPEQKSTFETGTCVHVSNRNTVSDERGNTYEDEKGQASGLKIVGGRDA